MTTITDEELARELHRVEADQLPGIEQLWDDLGRIERAIYLAQARTARRLLAPTTSYTDEDVRRLTKSATRLVDVIDGELPRTWLIDAARDVINVLDVFQPLKPTPEQLRMERGKAACVAAYSGATWEELPDSIQEEWCRITDVVLAKQAEQDREAGT